MKPPLLAPALVLGWVAALAGCGARTGLPLGGGAGDSGGGSGGEAGPGGGTAPNPKALTADKIDLLFMIDNSLSMADKQQILATAVPDLVNRLVSPLCVDASGQPLAGAPPRSTDPCPDSFHREFNPVQDIHLGIVSSSLGGHGADLCSLAIDIPGFEHRAAQDDHGHLVTRGPAGSSVVTYQGLGFLAWDPAGTLSPPGESSATTLNDRFTSMVKGTGESGCGAESQLEAWYRFLISPDPPLSFARGECTPGDGTLDCAHPVGTDQTLLQQRKDFLRPDSLVVVTMLTDEDDCSVREEGRGFQILQVTTEDGHTPFVLPPASSGCSSGPGDPCCRNCGAPVPAGCPSNEADPACLQPGKTLLEDRVNYRCFSPKQRYGIDALFPVQRYVRGLTQAEVPDRTGALRPNPLFEDLTGAGRPVRGASLVYLAGIVGVPWQDLAVDPSDKVQLVYKSGAELDTKFWATVLGDPAHGVKPLDGLMVESIEPRQGKNPATGAPLAPPEAPSPAANPINGHELLPGPSTGDLQYACLFDLVTPRDCSAVDPNTFCVCSADQLQVMKAMCQDSTGQYGLLQRRAGAQPAVRQLEVLRGLGANGVVSSICARNLTDPSRGDFGYRPALRAILDRLRLGLR